MTPCCRLVLIESPGRGWNFRKISDARVSSFLLFLTSLFSLLNATQRDAARRDASRLHTKRERTMHTHERTVSRATYFCRTSSCSPLANCPSSAIPYILPSSRLLATPLRSLSSRRTTSPFYPLFFILYPLYPGLPRQADAEYPEWHNASWTGFLPTRSVSHFSHWSRIAPRMVSSSSFVCVYVCMCVRVSPVPFSPSLLPSFTPSVQQSRFLPLFLSLRAVLRAR